MINQHWKMLIKQSMGIWLKSQNDILTKYDMIYLTKQYTKEMRFNLILITFVF